MDDMWMDEGMGIDEDMGNEDMAIYADLEFVLAERLKAIRWLDARDLAALANGWRSSSGAEMTAAADHARTYLDALGFYADDVESQIADAHARLRERLGQRMCVAPCCEVEDRDLNLVESVQAADRALVATALALLGKDHLSLAEVGILCSPWHRMIRRRALVDAAEMAK